MQPSEETITKAELPNKISSFKLHAFLQNDALTQRITSDLEQLNYAQILTSLALGSLQSTNVSNSLASQSEEQTLNTSNAENNRDYSQRQKRRVKPSIKIREFQEFTEVKRIKKRYKTTAPVTKGSREKAGDSEVRGKRFWRDNGLRDKRNIVRNSAKNCLVKRDALVPNVSESSRKNDTVKKNSTNSGGRFFRQHKKDTGMKDDFTPVQRGDENFTGLISEKISGNNLGIHDALLKNGNQPSRNKDDVTKETKTEVNSRDSKEAMSDENGHSDDKSRYKCEQCGKYFKTYYTFSIHVRMPEHTKETPFVCDVCGKGFRLSSTLCRHKIIHTNNKPHQCTVCRKTFNRSSTLKMHMRTHSTRKQHVCTTCGKGFHQKGNLRNHMFVHSGERPFCCETCGRHFNKKSNLKHHLTVHEMNGKFSCTICKKVFGEHNALKEHMKTKHCHL